MKRGLTIAAVAVALVVGVIASRSLGDGHRPTTSAAERVTVAATSDGAMPEVAARDQALDFVTGFQRWLYLDDETIEAQVRSLTTTAAASIVATDVLADVRVARAALTGSTGRVWWVVRPLATRVEGLSERWARVSVWTVTVLSAADVAAPQSEWSTVTVDLEREVDGWRVGSTATLAGPTPAIAPNDEPWPAERLDAHLGKFVRIGAEAEER